MTTYLRKPGGVTWHWCRNCSRLPREAPLEVLYARPATGRLCAECLAKERAGECLAAPAEILTNAEWKKFKESQAKAG